MSWCVVLGSVNGCVCVLRACVCVMSACFVTLVMCLLRSGVHKGFSGKRVRAPCSAARWFVSPQPGRTLGRVLPVCATTHRSVVLAGCVGVVWSLAARCALRSRKIPPMWRCSACWLCALRPACSRCAPRGVARHRLPAKAVCLAVKLVTLSLLAVVVSQRSASQCALSRLCALR